MKMEGNQYEFKLTQPETPAASEAPPATAGELLERGVAYAGKYLWDEKEGHHRGSISNVLPHPEGVQISFDDGELLLLPAGKMIRILDGSTRHTVTPENLIKGDIIVDGVTPLTIIDKTPNNAANEGVRIVLQDIHGEKTARIYDRGDSDLEIPIIRES